MITVSKAKCAVGACDRPAKTRGRLCHMHYSRLNRWGSVDGRPPDPNLPGETWRAIPECPEHMVSSEGRVRFVGETAKGRPYKGKIITLRPNQDGYFRVKVRSGRSMFVHRLVALAFLGPAPEGTEVNHKDGLKHNNRPENLEYVTHRDNMRHASDRNLLVNVGQSQAKMRAGEVRAIRRLYRLGVLQPQLAYAFELDPSQVSRIVARKAWKHVD